VYDIFDSPAAPPEHRLNGSCGISIDRQSGGWVQWPARAGGGGAALTRLSDASALFDDPRTRVCSVAELKALVRQKRWRSSDHTLKLAGAAHADSVGVPPARGL